MNPPFLPKCRYKPPSTSLKGSGNFTACRRLAQRLLPASGGCLQPPCAAGDVSTPQLTGDFLAIGNFYYTARLLQLDENASLGDFDAAAQRYCATGFEAVQQQYALPEEMPSDYHLKACFSAAYISVILQVRDWPLVGHLC